MEDLILSAQLVDTPGRNKRNVPHSGDARSYLAILCSPMFGMMKTVLTKISENLQYINHNIINLIVISDIHTL